MTSWRLYNNVLIFKTGSESPLIYIIWLHEKKMAAIKHPYDDHKGKLRWQATAQYFQIRFNLILINDIFI